MTSNKRFIEESFPVKEVSAESAREKNIRHGHISTLHIWWARRPLASSRATNYAALIPAPKTAEEWNKKKNFIIELCKWENSNNTKLIEKARQDILEANGGKPPKVLDPFAGGGAIPLEALRLGCEVYSNDLNPVAVLIQKCTLEYPQKYGQPVKRKVKREEFGKIIVQEEEVNPLLEDVKKWGQWVLDEAKKELAQFYPNDPDLPAPRQNTYWIYVLKCSDTSFYIGQTDNLIKRYEEHWRGKVSWTKSRLPVEIIHWESFSSREEAVKREKDLKTGFGRKWLKREYEKGRLAARQAGGSIPVGYIWARTIPCQNPACDAEIPLIRQFWLAKKSNKEVALYPYVEGNQVKFKIVGDGYEKMPARFEPTDGTVARAVATCLVCGATVDANTTRKLFQQHKADQRMVAIVTYKPGKQGKKYRIAEDKDLQSFNKAEEYLKNKREILMLEWGIDPVPDEPTPEGTGRGAERAFSIRNYGMYKWGDLFNKRQQLSLIIFVMKIRNVYAKIIESLGDKKRAEALISYLALILDSMADHNATSCQWRGGTEDGSHTFGRQTISMNWDYFEVNLLSGSTGSFNSATPKIYKDIEHCSKSSSIYATSNNSSATSLKFTDNFFDAVITDPPYYDNVPYSYLSDFFYVWLKRSIGNIFAEQFSTPLTPKKNEIVTYSNGPEGFDGGKKFFESMLKRSFQEIYRVLKPNGISVIVYAHKSTEGWETLINSLLDSGLIMTGAWPLNTEMQSRLRASESAALASSIYIIARKMKRQPTGFYNNVKEELNQYLSEKLERLWQEGISGSDFFIAAIGSAIEVFGKYEQVIDYEGNMIRADRLLLDVRKIVTDFAVRQILHDGFVGEITDLTRFYVLFRWNFGAVKVHFDEARKLAQSCSIDLAREWGRPGFIKKEKEFIRVIGPQDRRQEEIKHPTELIDVLHKILLLWEKSKRQDILDLLNETGYGQSEAFYRVAQAISETLPNDNKEKKLLDGFLSGRERLKEEVKKMEGQGDFFK